MLSWNFPIVDQYLILLYFFKLFVAKTQPFKLTFNTDSYEFKKELDPTYPTGDLGFKLAYIQSSTC